jgi:acetoacetate decarboxylase
MLPERFELGSEPVVTVTLQYIKDIEWLAGRGYNTLGISFPAFFNGKKKRVVGNFLAVIWENLADAIISGREELGFSKIYCEIPEFRKLNRTIICTAQWMDFKFLDLEIKNMVQVPSENIQSLAKAKRIDGTLHYKYIPKTEDWGKSNTECAVLTPADDANCVIKEAWNGEGIIKFHKATWKDLPTSVNIVNTIQNLEIKEYRGAKLIKTVGGKDLSDQCIIE